MSATTGGCEAGYSAGVRSLVWSHRHAWRARSAPIWQLQSPSTSRLRRLRQPTRMKSPLRLALLALILILVLGGPSILRFYTDWLWFGEVGYRTVFLTMFRSQGALFSLTFAVATAWLVVNLNVAVGAVGNVRPVVTTREGIQLTLPGGRQHRSL